MSNTYPGGFIIKNPVAPTTSAASGVWTISDAARYNKAGTWPTPTPPETLPPVSGYIGWYDANSFVAGTRWTDKSGNGNHATTLKGSPAVMTQPAGSGSSVSIKTVYGTGSDGIQWPTAILPSTYTLFHVARYKDSNKGRIFTGNGNNWLSGFWSGAAGVAYHGGWVTDQTDRHGYNWVYSTDQNYLYRSNGVSRGTSGGGTTTNLSILYGNYDGEVSDWQVAEVLVYSSTLNSTQITDVESYLKTKYGL